MRSARFVMRASSHEPSSGVKGPIPFICRPFRKRHAFCPAVVALIGVHDEGDAAILCRSTHRRRLLRLYPPVMKNLLLPV
jgi:hypothetical protein